jgi:hypothetical protein
MARGWESKSVEEQMAKGKEEPVTIVGTSSPSADEAKRQAQQARASRERERQALNLQRENILSQKTSSPVRRAALEAALKMIEGQLAELS